MAPLQNTIVTIAMNHMNTASLPSFCCNFSKYGCALSGGFVSITPANACRLWSSSLLFDFVLWRQAYLEDLPYCSVAFPPRSPKQLVVLLLVK